MQNRNRHLRVSQTQLQTLNRYPRHPGVWRQLGVRLGRGTRVVVGNHGVRLVRPGGTRR